MKPIAPFVPKTNPRKPHQAVLFACVFGASLSALAPPANAQESAGHIVVTPGAQSKEVVAIPDFEPLAGSALFPEAPLISKVIYRNLEISGQFRRPTNPSFVAETRAVDRRKGATDFAAWRRLEANFIVLGTVSARGGQLESEVRVYETNRGKRVIGKKYTGFPMTLPDDLGRRIADDIVYHVTGARGLAMTRIAFVTGKGWNKEIAVMYSDGGGRRVLTNEKSTIVAPGWGKDGGEIFFTSYKNYNPDLVAVTPDGKKRWPVSIMPGLNVSPNWSAARQRLVLTLGKDGNSEIYTMDRDGRNRVRLTRNRKIDSSPCWSPSGRRICFTSNRSGSPQIYVMDYDGLSLQLLTKMGSAYSYNDGAVWSPKGDKIAFSGRYRGKFDIYTMNVDGTGPQRLTDTPGNNEDPCWSPDGTHIVFTSDRSSGHQIWVMRADGTSLTQLTSRGNSLSPAWGPFPK